MRNLLLTRGAPGCGKSTFLKNNGLEQYALSPDNIRLLFQSPVLVEDGSLKISIKNEKKVWELLFQLLESRMQRGEFTVIDATHSKPDMISQYKKLAQKYRYRVTVVDFSDVPLETILEQNRLRDEHKHVPELSIRNHFMRTQTQEVPSWVTVIKPDEYKDTMKYPSMDFSQWKKIHHIGDIHGCYDALMAYLDGGLKEDELYIFVGDLVDRGLQNAEVVNFFIEICAKPNVILLEGNHEIHLWNWANDEEIKSRIFKNITAPELEAAGIDKKDVRQLYRRLRQVAYYTYKDKTVVVTHGGLSKPVDNFVYIATEQFIKGVGDYEVDIDEIWDTHTEGEVYQIHGHRNIFRVPVKASQRSFNLEGQVEMGGYLRAVTLSEDGFVTHTVKNHVYKAQKMTVAPTIDEDKLTTPLLLEYLTNHKYIKEKQVSDAIYSYNFSRDAFEFAKWDDMTVKARGLFINKNTNEIVNRSYNKFFNISERRETKLGQLADNLVFPVDVYTKPNGYLGMLGYDSENDELIFSSKSEINGPFAEWFKELFYATFSIDKIEWIKRELAIGGYSFIFEVILTEKDPHIIKYEKDHLVLLDIVKRTAKYEKVDYSIVADVATHALGIEHKKKVLTIDNWIEFYGWYKVCSKNMSIEEEGYVIEDSSGFMFKLKLPYYNFWKQMRSLTEAVYNKHTINYGRLYTELHTEFLSFLKKFDPKELKSEFRRVGIIGLRDQFYEQKEKEQAS